MLAGDATVRNLLWNQVLWSKNMDADFDIMSNAFELNILAIDFANVRLSGQGLATFTGVPAGQCHGRTWHAD